MTCAHDPLSGAFLVSEKLTLAEVWTGIHASAASYEAVSEGPDAQKSRDAIKENDLAVLGSLNDCPATRWQALIESLGITQYGAIGLSWCRGATLLDVARAFQTLNLDVAELDRRALLLLAPHHGASERRLSQLVKLADQDMGVLTLLCLGSSVPLSLDISGDWLSSLPQSLQMVVAECAAKG